MIEDSLILCIQESLNEMDSMEILEDVSLEYGCNPLDNLIQNLSESEVMDILFPSELNSENLRKLLE